MTRRLLNLLTGLSLLLFVAVVTLWVRSYAVSQFLGWSDPTQFVGALSMRGLVRLEHGTWPNDDQGWSYIAYPTDGRGGLWQEALARDRRGGPLRVIGVAYARVYYTPDATRVRRALYLPYWLLAGATLPVPLWRLCRTIRARRRRASRGLCASCGYDLRATPDCCPECGVTPAGATA
jgi:hypothetical protein